MNPVTQRLVDAAARVRREGAAAAHDTNVERVPPFNWACDQPPTVWVGGVPVDADEVPSRQDLEGL